MNAASAALPLLSMGGMLLRFREIYRVYHVTVRNNPFCTSQDGWPFEPLQLRNPFMSVAPKNRRVAIRIAGHASVICRHETHGHDSSNPPSCVLPCLRDLLCRAQSISWRMTGPSEILKPRACWSLFKGYSSSGLAAAVAKTCQKLAHASFFTRASFELPCPKSSHWVALQQGVTTRGLLDVRTLHGRAPLRPVKECVVDHVHRNILCLCISK